jgi:2-polyprenyl-6-methoxyphenol hydroxylase-like FAD-dependent oxidoreductase
MLPPKTRHRRKNMSCADVAVIGGGAAGSLTVAMLGRAGNSTIIVDIHETYPEEFRWQKIHDDQAELLVKTGLADGVLSEATPIREMCLTRSTPR